MMEKPLTQAPAIVSRETAAGAAVTGAPAAGGRNQVAWTRRITSAWNKTRDGVIEVGRLLIAAKAALKHGEFQEMIGVMLPFTPSTAQRLMKIARDVRILDHRNRLLMPASWGTLYEIAKLDDEIFDRALRAGIIKPDAQRADITAFRAQMRQSGQRRGREVAQRRWDRLISSSGSPYGSLDAAQLAAEIERMRWLPKLLAALADVLPPTGVVRDHISADEFDHMAEKARR